MDDVADVGAEDNQSQRAEDLSALRGHHPGHVGEHADGAQGNDEAHQPVDHGIGGVNHIPHQLGLFAGYQNGAAEQQGDDDDLKHIGIGKGFPHIGGEDSHQRCHEAGVLLGLILGGLGGFRQVGEQARAVEDAGQHQTDDAGDGGGDHEVNNSFPAHGADLLHVAHGDDAVDHGQQHHGNHDEFQQVHEDIAEGLDIIGGEVSGASKIENQAHNDAQHQSNKDLSRQ